MIPDLASLLWGAVLNLAVALFIARFIYYRVTPDRNYVFSFLAFNTVTYFVMSLLTSAEIGIGAGFGLFAIFSVMRYRTEETRFREMTYFFVFIALPLMNSILVTTGAVATLLAANAFVALLLHALERSWGFSFDESQRIEYERIELIAPDRREQLLEDLRQRTGLAVTRVEVGRLDLVRDTATLNVYFSGRTRRERVTLPIHEQKGADR